MGVTEHLINKINAATKKNVPSNKKSANDFGGGGNKNAFNNFYNSGGENNLNSVGNR
jgi:hypothetical protein